MLPDPCSLSAVCLDQKLLLFPFSHIPRKQHMKIPTVCAYHQRVGVTVCLIAALSTVNTGKLKLTYTEHVSRFHILGFPSCFFLKPFQTFIDLLSFPSGRKKEKPRTNRFLLQKIHKAAYMVIIPMAHYRNIQSFDSHTV